ATALLDQNAATGLPTADDNRARSLVLATRPEHRREAIAILENLNLPTNAPPDFRFLLAQLYDRDGRWQEARAELNKVLKEYPKNQVVITYLARALIRRGDVDSAQSVVDRLAEAAGENNFTVVELRARVLMAKERPADAARTVRVFVQIHG